MKILAIVGSPRKNGKITKLAEQILEGARYNSNETKLINLYDFDIKPCLGDWACVKLGTCHIKDDFEKIYNKLVEADVVILGSPVYWANVTGVMKNFFDRHTGYAMYKPPNAANFHKLSKWSKIKTMIKLVRKFGPNDPRFKKKNYILLAAATVPFKRIMGEVSPNHNCYEKICSKIKRKSYIKNYIHGHTFSIFREKKAENDG